MKYISTRGQAPKLGFSEVVLTGLATDGGLYVPETWPRFEPSEIADLAGLPYHELAFKVIRKFTQGDLDDNLLASMTREAYSTFRHPATVPLVQLGTNHFLLELFHGPTLAFKDVAMQFLARLMDHILTERDQRATIVGATSGDTGGAAIDAFAGRKRVDISILFPDGRVSAVQRRQMTTLGDQNVQALAIEGTFDDTQALVKSMFADKNFRDRVHLSGVNSINWGRIVAQTAYYFAAGVALGAPHRSISFTVPTGNFGNIFAGYVAKAMGLPIDRLNIATNVNDILHRTLEHGRYEVAGVTQTNAPSMDIQISSNFERLLFDVEDRDADQVVRHMNGLAQSGAFTLDSGRRNAIRQIFKSGSCDDIRADETIRRTLAETGYLLDPHTAIGVAVAEDLMEQSSPMVTLATAHPAKFPAAVEAACGVCPNLPDWLGDLMDREGHYSILPNDLDAVEAAVESRCQNNAAKDKVDI